MELLLFVLYCGHNARVFLHVGSVFHLSLERFRKKLSTILQKLWAGSCAFIAAVTFGSSVPDLASSSATQFPVCPAWPGIHITCTLLFCDISLRDMIQDLTVCDWTLVEQKARTAAWLSVRMRISSCDMRASDRLSAAYSFATISAWYMLQWSGIPYERELASSSQKMPKPTRSASFDPSV